MKITKSLITAAVSALLSGVVLAAPSLTVTGGAATTLANFENISTTGYASEISNLGTEFDVGALLSLNYLSDVTFTFVGKEAGFANKLFVFNAGQFNNSVLVGTSLTFTNVAVGALNFGFQSNSSGPVFSNPNSRIGFMTNSTDTSALALFNDSFNDGDFDDMGVTIAVTAVPEVETYAMMLAGLGLMGTIARRRNKVKVA